MSEVSMLSQRGDKGQPQQAMGTALREPGNIPMVGMQTAGTNNKDGSSSRNMQVDTAGERGELSSLSRWSQEGRPLPPGHSGFPQCVPPPWERCHPAR